MFAYTSSIEDLVSCFASSISLTGVVLLNPGDYIELWVENINDSSDITIESMNLVIK